MKGLSRQNTHHLQQLENESIFILRETAAEMDNPAILYSIGKDSSVLLHLAAKAFYPAKIPLPLIHIDTTWKFKEMIAFRDETVARLGLKLIVHTNKEGLDEGVSPLTHDSAHYTDIMKTAALKQVLDQHCIDAAVGGARRDEEKSRSKERIFSLRNQNHHWDPKQQRPELWHQYHLKKLKEESFRVFPLSNWTELDIWQYIFLENIQVVPLYFAARRPVVRRQNQWIVPDDARFNLKPSENIVMKNVRFRTLGCYPLTAAMASTADTVPKIIEELYGIRVPERQGRMIDHDTAASMEKKKREGYF